MSAEVRPESLTYLTKKAERVGMSKLPKESHPVPVAEVSESSKMAGKNFEFIFARFTSDGKPFSKIEACDGLPEAIGKS